MIIYIIFIMIIIFAIYKETREYNDSFILGKYNKTHNITKILENIKICMSYDLKTIKWRNVFITSFISTIILFLIVFARFPSSKELLLFVIIIFLSITFMWKSYINKTVNEVNKYCNENILHIYKEIKQNNKK